MTAPPHPSHAVLRNPSFKEGNGELKIKSQPPISNRGVMSADLHFQGCDNMFYYHSISSRFNDLNITYSIDKVILTGKFFYKNSELFMRDLSVLELQDGYVDDMPFDKFVDNLGYYVSNRIGTYMNNFNIKLVNDRGEQSSFFLGVVLNSGSDKVEQWKLEFNPNKILPCPFFEKMLSLLKKYTIPSRVKLKSWDLSIDFPLNRLNVSLERDKRMYQLITKSALDRTEYLGVRQTSGFCKLYNKTVESSLDYDLTRFEISLDSVNYLTIMSKMPKLLMLQNSQMTFDILNNLSQNQVVMLELLSLHPEYLQKLDNRGRAKYKSCLDKMSHNFVLDKKCVDYLVVRVYSYVNLEVLK